MAGLPKNTLKNDGFAIVADASGELPLLYQRAQGEQQKPLCDIYGRLYVVPIETIPFPGYPTELHYASGGSLITQVKVTPNAVTPGYIIGITGYNSHTTDTLYVQIHDVSAASIANGAVPEIIIPVPGNKTPFSYGLQHIFENGFLIAISTTELTFTAPAANYLSTVVRLQTA